MWQPIETAPKTSRARLVWVPEIRCTFCVTWRGDETQGEWGVFGGGINAVIKGPTHWMPLPDPPAHLTNPRQGKTAPNGIRHENEE